MDEQVAIAARGPADLRVASIESLALRLPLATPVAGASARPGVSPNAITTWDVVLVTVTTDAGIKGLGFTYAIRGGAPAVLEVLRHELEPLVLGADCWSTERLWNRLYWATYNAGRRGVLIHALSAIDIALWDARAKAAEVSVARLLGADRDSVPVYESNTGWLSASIEELVRGCAAGIEQGMCGTKVFVGLPDPREDERRVEAVRRAIGEEPLIMVDAGQKWGFRSSLERIRRLEKFGVYWVEEPLPVDDVAGHERLARRLSTRLATGQSMTTRFEVLPFLERQAVDVLQVDVARIGGITEWWRVAHLAEAVGVELAPHFLPELHVSLVAASPVGAMVEYTPWLSAILDEPPVPTDGEYPVPAGPGHGLRLRSDLERFRLA